MDDVAGRQGYEYEHYLTAQSIVERGGPQAGPTVDLGQAYASIDLPLFRWRPAWLADARALERLWMLFYAGVFALPALAFASALRDGVAYCLPTR